MKHRNLLFLLVFVGSFSFLSGIALKEQVLSLFSAPRVVGGFYENRETAKQLASDILSLDDLKLICECYLSDAFGGTAGGMTLNQKQCLYKDRRYFYVLSLKDGCTSYAAQRYGIKIDRKTGRVFNRHENQWRTYGYTAKTPDAIRSHLNERMGLNEILTIMGRPFLFSFSNEGCLSLEYNTKGGVIFVSLKNGRFLRVFFSDHATAVRL